MRLYVLQSYRSCTFCKRKTRGETQFWIELAAPCTLANYNEINSDDTMPFSIFLTPVSYDGSNLACCYSRVTYMYKYIKFVIKMYGFDIHFGTV